MKLSSTGIIILMLLFVGTQVAAQSLPSTTMYWIENVEIDGEFAEWARKDSAATRNSLYGDHSARDGEAKVTLATDGTTLYIYANVRDDVPTENGFHSAIAWKGDSLDIYFGPAAGQRKDYNNSDVQLRLVPRSKEDIFEGSVFIGYDFSGGGVPLDRGADIATVYRRNGYEIEASIPLFLLNIPDLRPGQRTRCDFQLNDADEVERDRLVKWSSDEDDYYTPAKWGFCEIEQ